MTLAIPDEIAESAEKIAKTSGISPQTLLINALLAHFPPVPSDLQAEFDEWDRASEEDTAKMEENGLRW